MTEISFYHLTSSTLEKALPKLIEKIYSLGLKIVILCENNELIQIIDEILWSYSTKTFLAHATYLDPHPEKQPIYITDKEENPNQASILIKIGENIPNYFNEFDKYLDIFSGNNQNELAAARSRYKIFKSKESTIKYWKQDESGNWELAKN